MIFFQISCEQTLDGSVVHTGLLGVHAQVLQVEHTNVEAMESLLAQLGRSLHPNHAAILELTQALSGIYREQIMDEGNIVPTGLLKRKLELCSLLLPVIDKLEPPMSRLRGKKMSGVVQNFGVANCVIFQASLSTRSPLQWSAWQNRRSCPTCPVLRGRLRCETNTSSARSCCAKLLDYSCKNHRVRLRLNWLGLR
jgi:hypothetical protein